MDDSCVPDTLQVSDVVVRTNAFAALMKDKLRKELLEMTGEDLWPEDPWLEDPWPSPNTTPDLGSFKMLTETELLDMIMTSYPLEKPGCVAFSVFHDKMLNDVYPAYLELKQNELAMLPTRFVDISQSQLEDTPVTVVYTEPVPGYIHATTEPFPLNGAE